jgi:sec-independent protein translocase protein TatA
LLTISAALSGTAFSARRSSAPRITITEGILLMGSGIFKPYHILILVLVIVILFGWKRLPDAARSLGRSMRIFKSEVEEMKNDGKTKPSAASGDTVKGETVHPTPDESADPIADPTKSRAADPVERETHNQPPA